MYQEILLSGTWELRDEILSLDLRAAHRLSQLAEGWIETPVPGDIHQGLIAADRIKEPLLGLNSYDCEWTERRSWWFRKRFQAPPDGDVVELELNGLDSNAEIFLNGIHIGSHRNTFRPFVLDIKPWLQTGENTLLVRLTAGVETVTELDLDAPDGVRMWTEAQNGRPDRGDTRRQSVRKPQYTFGWDWSPRLATTAIAGDVKIRVMSHACIRHIHLQPQQLRDGAVMVNASVTVDRLHYYKTTTGTLTLTLTDETGQTYTTTQTTLLRSGYNFLQMSIRIDDPQLWYPNGLGMPHLYCVEAELVVGTQQMSLPPFYYGIRFVELDTTEDIFAIIINSQRVFCKGGNWIPADAIYARVNDEQYDTLIREAKEANFNMLRIWGGGWYERDAFYEACNRYGIMVWHDFMLTCGVYPDHLTWFREEMRQEADYQTKRLRHHPCLVLWCGNNENHWFFAGAWQERTQRGAYLYNYLLPEIVQHNCPEIPYWNSSPYGGNEPNSDKIGDQHRWAENMMNPDMETRITPEEYDLCTSRFLSEFGYVGAVVKESLLTYLDGEPLYGDAWHHHTNVFERNTVAAGIRKHYADPDTLSMEDYLLYSGLCQGMMLSYAFDTMRANPSSHGALFWMYNDCWGEIGWTIIDYYLRRKPSWYFAQRAFAPIRVILRPGGNSIRIMLANDTTERLNTNLEYGYVTLDGTIEDLHSKSVKAPPMARTDLGKFERGTHAPTTGLWIARIPQITSAIFRAVNYRQLQTTDPLLSTTILSNEPNQAIIEITAERYAHAVHFDMPTTITPSDAYFDLLPGEKRPITFRATSPFDPSAINVTCVNKKQNT